MREILFRGKRTDSGEWIEGDLLQIKYYNKPIIECKIMPQTPVSSAVPVLPETVGQYAGLTDRNGKRIFEGDIIKRVSDGERAVISWLKYSACFGLSFDGWCCGFDNYFDNYDDNLPGDFEVVGNIHDNPELMGEEVNE